jgi:two-component system chemotaxis sensor kinase CheA
MMPMPPPQRRRRRSSGWGSADASIDRLAEPTRHRLAAAATAVFVEYLSARGVISRNRLRDAWTSLRDSIARTCDTELEPQLARHIESARQIASGLGKHVELELAVGNVRVETHVAEAIDVAVLHLLRNAIDHGIEARGTVSITAAHRGGDLEIAITDDGRGIDITALRAKLAPGRVVADADLVFEPGLSTKARATEVSGRGVGMDAVKTAIERVGGTIRIATSAAGTTVTIAVRALVRDMPAYQFFAPGGGVSIAVSARWTPSVEMVPAPDAIDPLRTIHMLGRSRQTNPGDNRSIRALSIRLRWGFLELSMRAASEPRLVTGERVCATSDDHPLEVIAVEGVETLLFRPEHVGELAAAWAGRPVTSASSAG